MGDLHSMLADIRSLMVAGSSWAKELFFENSQGIGAVRKSETTTKYQAFNDLTLHEPFLSAFRQNVPSRDIRDVFIQSAKGKSAARCEQRVYYLLAFGFRRGKYYQNDAGRNFTNLNYRISYW